MSNTLFIRPYQVHQSAEQLFEWALYDIAGVQIKYGPSASLDLIDQTLMQNGIENTEVIAYWPSYATFSTQISLPGNQARLIQQALPFAVEEQIAQEIEQMHIALGGKNKFSAYTVFNVDYALFEAFFNSLMDESLAPTLKAIYVDADMLPYTSQDLVLCISASQVLIKNHDQRSISLHPDNVIPYLDSLFLGQPDMPADDEFKIQIFIEQAQSDHGKMLVAQIEQYPNVIVTTDVMGISQFEFICEQYFKLKSPVINLCQGDFKASSDAGDTWKKWRAVAVIAGLGFLLQLGVFIGQGMYYQQKADQAGQQALAQYQKIVPDSKRITLDKLPRIIKGKLNQKSSMGDAGVDFLSLLGEAGYQFKRSQYNAQLKFKSINYNDQHSELLLEMQAKSFDQLEHLKQAIVRAGLTAKIISNVQEKEFVRGRISVSGVPVT